MTNTELAEMSGLVRAAGDYTEQASITNWPVRIALVLIVVGTIALALWGMRRGWRNRQRRQDWIPEPLDAPPGDSVGEVQVEGVFLGTSTHGDWMDRIAVFDLGVRSRASVSWGTAGIWFQRDGARDLFVPAGSVAAVRTDRGVAGTVRAKDSVIVVTWRLGEATVDTGFRADDTTGHGAVLDGLVAGFATGARAGEQ